MKNNNLNNQTTKAYDLYAHKIFQRDIEKHIDDEPFEFNEGFTSELNLRKEIARHLSAWLLIDMPDWKDLKSDYIEASKNNSLNKEDKAIFNTYAKLYYCGDMLKTIDCTASSDLDVSNLLISSIYNMQKTTSDEEYLHNRRGKFNSYYIHDYLANATQETPECKTDYKELSNTSLAKLADELFKTIVTLQYNADHTVTCPIQRTYFNGMYTRDWDYTHVKDDNISNYDQALKLAKLNFKDWLDIDLHEQEIGRTLR